MECWYVVYTHAKAEQVAVSHLRRQGFDIYFPRYRRRRRHARKVDEVMAPLFPRYVFLRMDAARTPWLAVRSTVGVHSLVCQGSVPLALPHGAVDEIRAREDESGLVAFAEAPPYAKGMRLRISEGPMAEQLGLFEGIDDNHRIVLLLDLLGRQVRVAVPFEAVRAEA